MTLKRFDYVKVVNYGLYKTLSCLEIYAIPILEGPFFLGSAQRNPRSAFFAILAVSSSDFTALTTHRPQRLQVDSYRRGTTSGSYQELPLLPAQLNEHHFRGCASGLLSPARPVATWVFCKLHLRERAATLHHGYLLGPAWRYGTCPRARPWMRPAPTGLLSNHARG